MIPTPDIKDKFRPHVRHHGNIFSPLPAGVPCPNCGGLVHRCVDSRPVTHDDWGPLTKRTHRCVCGARWRTVELEFYAFTEILKAHAMVEFENRIDSVLVWANNRGISNKKCAEELRCIASQLATEAPVDP